MPLALLQGSSGHSTLLPFPQLWRFGGRHFSGVGCCFSYFFAAQDPQWASKCGRGDLIGNLQRPEPSAGGFPLPRQVVQVLRAPCYFSGYSPLSTWMIQFTPLRFYHRPEHTDVFRHQMYVVSRMACLCVCVCMRACTCVSTALEKHQQHVVVIPPAPFETRSFKTRRQVTRDKFAYAGV